MKNLLNRLVNRRKKAVRAVRTFSASVNADQISKMGRLGQSLVVMSR